MINLTREIQKPPMNIWKANFAVPRRLVLNNVNDEVGILISAWVKAMVIATIENKERSSRGPIKK